jgi:hypothetical protein
MKQVNVYLTPDKSQTVISVGQESHYAIYLLPDDQQQQPPAPRTYRVQMLLPRESERQLIQNEVQHDVDKVNITALEPPYATFEFLVQTGQAVLVRPAEHQLSLFNEEHVFFCAQRAQGTKRKRDEHLEKPDEHVIRGFRVPYASKCLQTRIRTDDISTFFLAQGNNIVEYLLDGTVIAVITAPFSVHKFVVYCEHLFAISSTGFRVWRYNMDTEEENHADWTPNHRQHLLGLNDSFSAVHCDQHDGSRLLLATTNGQVGWTPLNLAGLIFWGNYRNKSEQISALARFGEQYLLGSDIRMESSRQKGFFDESEEETAEILTTFTITNATCYKHDKKAFLATCIQKESTLRFYETLPHNNFDPSFIAALKIDAVVDCQVTNHGHLVVLKDAGFEVEDLGDLNTLLEKQGG